MSGGPVRGAGLAWRAAAFGFAWLMIVSAPQLRAAAPPAAVPPGGAASPVDPGPLPTYEVEWVYRVKWGHDEEFWRIFKRTQIPVLDKEKELGYVLNYEVYRPGLHTGEDSRWNYRLVITYKNVLASSHAREIEKALYPDRDAYEREENRRWELIDAHYDLPIRQIDPHAAE